jgi:hypothetical protein
MWTWVIIWTALALLCFILGYSSSMGVTYAQKPLSLGHRLAHGATIFTYFFAPNPYQLA